MMLIQRNLFAIARVLVVTELVVRGYFPNISACPSRQDLKNNFLDSKIHSSGMSIKTVTVTTCLHVIAHLHCRRRTRLRTQTEFLSCTEIGSRDLSRSLCNVNMFCIAQCSHELGIRIRVRTRVRIRECK